jgi:8-oxo-dGTP diphosphatase
LKIESRGTKSKGASIIFVNSSNQVLLFLRDNKPSIPFPNRWDLLGGTVEAGETPRQCIVREIKEEIGYTLIDPQLFRVTDFDDRVEHTYFQHADLDIQNMPLNEGQRLKWFSKDEIQALDTHAIAFGFRPILLGFYDRQLRPEQRK